MFEDIEKGTYDAILVWTPDRLARNMKDTGEILDRLDTLTIKDIKFANGYYFQNDAAGKIMFGMAFVIAKQFIDVRSQNVRRGMTRITSEGKLYNRAKHDYYKDKNGYAQPNKENQDLIAHASEIRLSHDPKYSLRKIATWLREQGYPKKTKQLLSEHKGDVILVKEFKADLMKHLENHKAIEKKITAVEQEKEAGKTAIQSYEEFIELFGNLAERMQKIVNMEDLDFVLKKTLLELCGRWSKSPTNNTKLSFQRALRDTKF